MIKKYLLHFKKICIHKYWVSYYCFKMGIPWRSIKHDMSKFSPTEFWESVKYYQGTSSSIDACKAENGWSKAWQHHKGRNDHHYEYWVDDLDHGGKPLIMPFECALEMFCDYLGTGRAYYGKDFTYQKEYDWWMAKKQNPLLMHPIIQSTITEALKICKNFDTLITKRHFRTIYILSLRFFIKDGGGSLYE